MRAAPWREEEESRGAPHHVLMAFSKVLQTLLVVTW